METHDYTVLIYSTYLALTAFLTFWVARTLFKNGRVFLIDIFHNNKELADSVNKLLLVGFYLINIGYAVRTMKVFGIAETYREVLETLSVKLGFIILILGAMHFLNIFIFFKLRKKAELEKQQKKDEELLGI